MQFLVFSGPSGGGKTTMAELVSASIQGSEVLVKHTDRQQRSSESGGRDYHFTTADWFVEAKDRGILVAYEQYYGNQYALSVRAACMRANEPSILVLILNPKLALDFKRVYVHSLLFFVAAKPLSLLRERLKKRGSCSEEIQQREAYLELEIDTAPYLDVMLNTSEGLDAVLVQSLHRIRNTFPSLFYVGQVSRANDPFLPRIYEHAASNSI
jgi:guanylate kinase